jgi:CubicO group peptidase (beta-lactamase class C family)
MSPELYQQVDPDEVGMSAAYLGNIDALQERFLAENAYQGSVVLVARHGKVCYFIHILDPLQMHETWFFPPKEQHHRIAAVYWAGKDEKQTEPGPLGLGMLGPQYTFSPDQTYFSGAGGLHGTTADYFRFAQMLLNNGELDGVRVLSPASVRLMTTNQIGGLRNWQLTQNKWGYMVDIQEGENAPSGSLHYLGGPGAYSWQGFFSTKFVNNPRLDTVIMTMSTPGFDGALPHNLRIAAATAAVVD